MTFRYDPEIAIRLAEFTEQTRGSFQPERGDWAGLRRATEEKMLLLDVDAPDYPDVTVESFSLTVPDGATIALRWYSKAALEPGSAVVYAHGGGMIAGTLDIFEPALKQYVSRSGVPFLAVDYRLAPENAAECLTADLNAAHRWLIDHTNELGVDPSRIALMGDSGGGGVAAGAAQLARNDGLPLARQILIYPMLDDRTITPDPELLPFATWTYDRNFTAWSAVLGAALGGEVSPIVAPARTTDFSGLAPAYVEVGELDIFRDESVSYARGLVLAGISTELHVHPGAPHAFERMAPASGLARRVALDRARILRSL